MGSVDLSSYRIALRDEVSVARRDTVFLRVVEGASAAQKAESAIGVSTKGLDINSRNQPEVQSGVLVAGAGFEPATFGL